MVLMFLKGGRREGRPGESKSTLPFPSSFLLRGGPAAGGGPIPAVVGRRARWTQGLWVAPLRRATRERGRTKVKDEADEWAVGSGEGPPRGSPGPSGRAVPRAGEVGRGRAAAAPRAPGWTSLVPRRRRATATLTRP